MRPAALLAAVVLASGCRSSAVGSRMWNHYQHVSAVRNAVVRVDLPAAQAAARWVASHQDSTGLPAAALPYTDSIALAARLVRDAPDLYTAAAATARMGAACGSCHLAAGQGPHFVATASPLPAADTSLTERMALNWWAVNRMWDGLTGPSDASWSRGAIALVDVPHYQGLIQRSRGIRPVADYYAGRIRALAVRAPLTPPEERAEVYGEILSSCSGCHRAYRVRVHPEPGGY